jgi:hypothetical protein
MLTLATFFAAPSFAMDATIDGSAVRITLVAEKPEIFLGEPAFVRLVMENPSDKPLYFMNGGNYRNNFGRDDNYQISAKDDKGVQVNVPKTTFRAGGLMGFIPIPAHGSYTLDFFLPHWAPFEHEGSYTISLATHMQFSREGDITKNSPQFPLDVALQTDLKVASPDARKLGEIIDSWDKTLATMKPHDSTPAQIPALKKISTITDPRAVPTLARLAVKPFYQTDAIEALAKFSTEDAVAALKTALSVRAADLDAHEGATSELRSSSAERIRHFAAIALSQNTRPQAADALVEVRGDSFAPVRSLALHALLKRGTPADIRILEDLAKSQDAAVAQEATALLATRKNP